MTIFDSIKYPIPDDAKAWSDIPYELPVKIRDKFYLNLKSSRIPDNDYYGLVLLLRKTILEWEDDDI